MRHLICAGAILCAIAITVVSPSTCGAQERLSDAAVKIELRKELESDARFREVPIEFDVVDGIVTLRGALPSYYERSRIERISRSIKGVRRVTNRIVVMPFEVSDEFIQKALQQRLAADVSTHGSIKIQVHDGVAILHGQVASARERFEVESVAKQVRGVRAVRNRLELAVDANKSANDKSKPGPTDQELAVMLSTVAKTEPQLRGLPLTFQVTQGKVVITGEVVTDRQKFLIGALTRRIPGVRGVNNQVAVDPTASRHQLQLETASSLDKLSNEMQGILPLLIDPESGEVNVFTADHKIVLQGELASIYQKRQLLRQLHAMAPTATLVDHLSVKAESRDDTTVKEDLVRLFATDTLLADEAIAVAVQQGHVTLRGNVSQLVDKTRAVQLATRIRGVQEIENLLQVNASSQYSDDQLAELLQAKLQRNRDLVEVASQIQITVSEGVAKLQGQVPNWTFRSEVLRLATQTDGIRGVDNQLTVMQPQ